MTEQNIGKITEFVIRKFKVSVYLSNHAEKRLRKRIRTNDTFEKEIDEYVVASNILALGKKVINHCENNDDVAIIDNDMNISVIAEFIKLSDDEGEVRIITVLDKTQIYVKEGTTIVVL